MQEVGIVDGFTWKLTANEEYFSSYQDTNYSLKERGRTLEAYNCKNNTGEDSELEMYVTESNGS
jgi:hypothetical protein